jgi:hypothetical protein
MVVSLAWGHKSRQKGLANWVKKVGQKCARKALYGAPTHSLKNDLGQLKSLPNSTSRRPSGARKRGRPGSHLYLKSNVYYFHYVFADPFVERIGRSEIRLSLRTTNAIESINMSLRKITKNRGSFPSDDALAKLFYLSLHSRP